MPQAITVDGCAAEPVTIVLQYGNDPVHYDWDNPDTWTRLDLRHRKDAFAIVQAFFNYLPSGTCDHIKRIMQDDVVAASLLNEALAIKALET